MEDLKGIGERIRKVRNNFGLPQLDFCKSLNVSKPTLSDVENGKSKPSFDILFGLSSQFNVNLDFILYGIGPMFHDELFKELSNLCELARNSNDLTEMLLLLKNSDAFLKYMLAMAKMCILQNETGIARDMQLTKQKISIMDEINKKVNQKIDNNDTSTDNKTV